MCRTSIWSPGKVGDPVRVVRPDMIVDHYLGETPESLFVKDLIRTRGEALRREMEKVVEPEVLDQLDEAIDRKFLGLPESS